MKSVTAAAITFIACLFGSASAFVTPSRTFLAESNIISSSPFKNNGAVYINEQQPVAIQRQRRSMSSVATMSLFGLGGPEIAIILIAGAFLLGPQKLAELGKDAGKIAGELKDVPAEFQKGLKEGEENAKAMKKEIASAEAVIEEESK